MARKGKNTCIALCEKIISQYYKGKTYKQIAEIFEIPKSTVGDIVRYFKNENRIASIPQTGRPKLLTEHDEQVIFRKLRRNLGLSAPKVRAEVFKEILKKVSSSTIRTLKNNGYNGRIVRRKPLINAMNRKRRLDFAKQYRNKPEHFWYDVIFADESKYNVFGSDSCREIVWRRPNKTLKPINLLATVKHSARIMVWECITAARTCLRRKEYEQPALSTYITRQPRVHGKKVRYRIDVHVLPG